MEQYGRCPPALLMVNKIGFIDVLYAPQLYVIKNENVWVNPTDEFKTMEPLKVKAYFP